jgi:hypothetical protein
MFVDLVKDIPCEDDLNCCELEIIRRSKFDQNDYNEFIKYNFPLIK